MKKARSYRRRAEPTKPGYQQRYRKWQRRSNSPDVDFARIRAACQPHAEALVQDMLPNGQKLGNEWITLNPKRDDRSFGSFKINLQTGMWSDFALPDAKGGDIISLYAYLNDTSQFEASVALLEKLGGFS